MPGISEKRASFRALHKDNFFLMPNAWDAGSARVTQDLGAKAIATSSAAVAWSQGYADGHHFPPERLAITVADIALGTLMYRYFTMPISRPKLANVEAWYQRLTTRKAYQDHVMIDWVSMKIPGA